MNLKTNIILAEEMAFVNMKMIINIIFFADIDIPRKAYRLRAQRHDSGIRYISMI